jgi:hypothetical protein
VCYRHTYVYEYLYNIKIQQQQSVFIFEWPKVKPKTSSRHATHASKAAKIQRAEGKRGCVCVSATVLPAAAAAVQRDRSLRRWSRYVFYTYTFFHASRIFCVGVRPRVSKRAHRARLLVHTLTTAQPMESWLPVIKYTTLVPRQRTAFFHSLV